MKNFKLFQELNQGNLQEEIKFSCTSIDNSWVSGFGIERKSILNNLNDTEKTAFVLGISIENARLYKKAIAEKKENFNALIYLKGSLRNFKNGL